MKFDRSEGLQEESTAEVKEDFGTPPPPEKHYEALADISVYGMSLRGSSHVERCQPCQDYSDFRFIPEAGLLISAISDGVGSCALSHWGSYTVVTTVLNVLETELKAELQTKKFTEIEGKTIGAILRKAFLQSKDAVEDLADHLTQPLPNFYSTLTAAIYDGSVLYYGHVGDDGIVVQLENGSYQLVTTRHKGEEANSVNPLQAGAPDQLWQFGRVSEPVVGFLMSTDGVLDQYGITGYSTHFSKMRFTPWPGRRENPGIKSYGKLLRACGLCWTSRSTEVRLRMISRCWRRSTQNGFKARYIRYFQWRTGRRRRKNTAGKSKRSSTPVNRWARAGLQNLRRAKKRTRGRAATPIRDGTSGRAAGSAGMIKTRTA